MARSAAPNTIVTFPTSLGWFALVGSAHVLQQLTFGHPSEEAAIEAVDPLLLETARFGDWNRRLVRRLQAYTEGVRDSFRDVEIDPGPQTAFQRRVVRCCRRIAYGSTMTYGRLADKAGHPGAARAVGQCMAANRVALVVPCHRVVASDGRLGGYSASGGPFTKLRLLLLESRNVSKRRTG
jgi:methylated-DNA-[protein]-cysteine S-methyltransferase